MAGHSKFANIKHRKGAQDAKRAKIFTKLTREILTAAKIGGNDPDSNYRLRSAITAARAQNVPKDRIEFAINKAANPGNDNDFVEMRYEGYAPGGTALIIEALTDNKNRTAAEIRSSFSKYGGNLGETGSVSFMFDKLGIIEYESIDITNDEILEYSINAGASDCESINGKHIIKCSPDLLNNVREFMTNHLGDPNACKLVWEAKDHIEITNDDQIEKLEKLIDVLEDNEDVQQIFTNFILSSNNS